MKIIPPIILLFFLLSVTPELHNLSAKVKRSIDLSATHAIIPDSRLPLDVFPNSYDINLKPNIEEKSFKGHIKISMNWTKTINKITLHAHFDLEIQASSVKLLRNSTNSGATENIAIRRCDRMPKKTVYVIYLAGAEPACGSCELSMTFEGGIWEGSEGLFLGTYKTIDDYNAVPYLATNMKPNNARRLFPCFDEPNFKVPFTVAIARPMEYVTLFNTQINRTEEMNSKRSKGNYVIDYFKTTPPMSTFNFGFVIAKLNQIDYKNESSVVGFHLPKINLWTVEDVHSDLETFFWKLNTIHTKLWAYFNATIPLSKIDVIVIPSLPTVHPIDNWGLITFKDIDIHNSGYYNLAQELIYQWLGSWITPVWWNDAHTNKALVRFIAADVTFDIDNGIEFNGKYPMTILYSIFYEFSKRFPHSKITGMKQETTSYRTELVVRMLNITLGKSTFRKAIQNFISNRFFGTFNTDDIWNSLNEQAKIDGTLPNDISVAEIAGSWISKDRLPVIFVNRSYAEGSAIVTQNVYLRERPHDLPNRDKMFWWVPLVIVRQDDLNFSNTRPQVWMDNSRTLILTKLPSFDNFIIVNPEEIGPFPVNYDLKNWNLLSDYLQTENGLTNIPTYTKAKLLHDAWNLAYAGDLSFATAFNMTLFMKFERNPVVWDPVFTFIDQIGRHIDGSNAHTKFETYVRFLLTPLYEELILSNDSKTSYKGLLSIAETFLCRAGYEPCLLEAHQVFKSWMDSSNPDQQIMVHNKFICPVFKWGTLEEWNFGLLRVLHYDKSRKQSDRTYLLKALANCPTQPEKIIRLLNLTLLESNGNLTKSDITLILNTLKGGSNGYKTLFKFISNNWTIIKQRFENDTNLWDILIGSATGSFTTNEGYDIIHQFYEEHKNEFGSALHIIENSLKTTFEEAKWSNENLPVIEKWLDNFLVNNNYENSTVKSR